MHTPNLQNNNDFLKNLGVPFYYVSGNDDFILNINDSYYLKIHDNRFQLNEGYWKLVETWLRKKTKLKKIKHNISSFFQGIKQSGIYAPITPLLGKFVIKNKNEGITVFGCSCRYGLKSKIKNVPKEYADIYLSHLPSLGTLDLSARYGIDHIGSKELLYAVKEHQPKLVICGHSHMWGGFSEKVGNTYIVNISSHDSMRSPTNYALIDTDDWSVEIKEEKTTRLQIRGMTTIRTYQKEKRYFDNEENLTNIDSHKNLDAKIKRAEDRVKERIESLEWEKPKIIKKITIKELERCIFLDVETGLANGNKPGKLWLIGLWHNKDLRQFIFPKEKKVFLKYLMQNKITALVSWTQYDHNALRPVFRESGMTMKFIDACQRVSNCVIWHSYKLHELYEALFPSDMKNVELIPGQIAGLYADHLIISDKFCPYCPSKETIIEKIKTRNKEDILQMVKICNTLQ